MATLVLTGTETMAARRGAFHKKKNVERKRSEKQGVGNCVKGFFAAYVINWWWYDARTCCLHVAVSVSDLKIPLYLPVCKLRGFYLINQNSLYSREEWEEGNKREKEKKEESNRIIRN